MKILIRSLFFCFHAPTLLNILLMWHWESFCENYFFTCLLGTLILNITGVVSPFGSLCLDPRDGG